MDRNWIVNLTKDWR